MRLAARLCVQVLIQTIELSGRVAVKIEPPDTGEDLLIEDSSIGTEEGPLLIGEALMPDLAASLNVSIHARKLTVTSERCLGRNVEDGIVQIGLA